MREVDLSLKVTGHVFMVGEFATIVIGDGMYPILMRHGPLRDSVSNRLGGLVVNRTNDGIAGLALGPVCGTKNASGLNPPAVGARVG